MKTHVLQSAMVPPAEPHQPPRLVEFRATNGDAGRDGFVDLPTSRTVVGIGESTVIEHRTDVEFVRVVTSDGVTVEALNGTADWTDYGRRVAVVINIGD